MIPHSSHLTLVLGVGNTLLSDDGVGIHLLHRLTSYPKQPPATRFLDGGTLSFTLLNEIQSCRNLIVMDAAELHAEPGTVRCMIGDDMDKHLRSGRKSVHEVGLADLLDAARLTGHLPENRALVAIQPQSIKWGNELSASVKESLIEAEALIVQLLIEWLTTPTIRNHSSSSQTQHNGLAHA